MSIYKDCDIRGIFGKDLDGGIAYDIGRAVGTIIDGKSILVCGDVRTSTPELKTRLIDGLISAGAQVIDMGLYPTPVFYFGKQYKNAYAGIMVTASHNPAEYNGFKLMMGDMPVVPEDIANIERVVQSGEFAQKQGSLTLASDVEAAYKKLVYSLIDGGGMRVVLDCGDGTTSEIAPAMFRDMGYDVVELYCGWDGSFPNRNPNPAVYSNLTDLQAKVLEAGADMGVAFDGDGDRVVFADETGNILMSEQALVLLIREYLKEKPSSVVYDLKSSSIVARETEKLGGTPIMERSGHAFIKRRYKDNDSALAGEISGHFFFKELGQDDGIYAALKLAEIVCKSGKKLSELEAGIEKTVITPDIRIPWAYAEQDALLEQIEKLAESYPISHIDGVRVDFGHGWALVRKSVTEQVVTVRIEAEDDAGVSGIIDILIAAAPGLDVPQLTKYSLG